MRTMIRRLRALRKVLIFALVTALLALFYLGPHPFSLRGAAAILAAGAAFGVVLLLFGDPPRGIMFYAETAVAGAAGGSTWWLIVQPSNSLLLAALSGATITVFTVVLEGRFGQRPQGDGQPNRAFESGRAEERRAAQRER
jgi:hypothetical protein